MAACGNMNRRGNKEGMIEWTKSNERRRKEEKTTGANTCKKD